MITGKKSYVLFILTGVFLIACHTSKRVTQNAAPAPASESFRLPDEEEEHGSSYIPKPDICETEDSISNSLNTISPLTADSISPHQ